MAAAGLTTPRLRPTGAAGYPRRPRWPPTTPSRPPTCPAPPAAERAASSPTSAARRTRSPARGATAAAGGCPPTTPRPRAAPRAGTVATGTTLRPAAGDRTWPPRGRVHGVGRLEASMTVLLLVTLAAAVAYDLRERRIPDAITLPAAVVALA